MSVRRVARLFGAIAAASALAVVMLSQSGCLFCLLCVPQECGNFELRPEPPTAGEEVPPAVHASDG